MHWCEPLPLYNGATKVLFHASRALPLHQTTKMTLWSQATSSNLAFNNRVMILFAPRVIAMCNAVMHLTTSYKEGSSQTPLQHPKKTQLHKPGCLGDPKPMRRCPPHPPKPRRNGPQNAIAQFVGYEAAHLSNLGCTMEHPGSTPHQP
jgi:hypothetical protein